MTSIRVNELTQPEPFSAVGVWWTTDESRRLPGAISLSAAGTELTVQGDLSLEDWPGSTTILGRTAQGEEVTIPGARLSGRGMNDDEVSTEDWVADSFLVGGLFPEGDTAEFAGLSLVTARMVDWTASMPLVDFRNRSVSAPEGPSMTCVVADLGRIELRSNLQGSFTLASASLDVVPTMRLYAASPMTMSRIWDDFVVPVIEFFTFATGLADGVLSLELIVAGEGRFPKTIQWHTRTHGLSSFTPGRLGSHRDLLPLTSMADQIDNRFQLWFEIERRFRPALRRFFSVILSPSGSTDEEFERTVRALEVWHRSDSDATKMPAKEYEELLETLCLAAPGHEEFLRERLKYQNSLSLSDRLRAIRDEAGSEVQASIATIRQFVRRTTETRNGLTHRSDIGDHFASESLPVVNRIWRAAMHAILLRRLGYSDAEVSTMFARSDDGLFLGDNQRL